MRKIIVLMISCLLVALTATTGFTTIVSTSDDVVQVSPPSSVGFEAYTNDTEIRVFDEQQNVELTSALTVDAVESKLYDDTADLPSPSPTIPKGIKVNSHFLHCDNVGIVGGINLNGTVTFDANILGVIIDNQDATTYLNQSDYLGLEPTTTYPKGSYRGLELQTNNDSFEISADRRTIEVDFEVWNWLDQIRVITEPSLIDVDIDIKPGSYPNSINLGSNGMIPVAILTTNDFDAATVNPDTVTLAGAGVAVKGKGNKSMSRLEDVDGDGDLDLVIQVETQNLDPGQFDDGLAILSGMTYDGHEFQGSDEIRIVPPK